MLKSTEVQALLLTPRSARRQYADMETFMEARLVGQQVEVKAGVVVEVSSVFDAGFNGLQVVGKTSDGQTRMGYFR